MILRKAYKYRLKTNADLESLLKQFAGSCRFVWNHALNLQKARLEANEGILSAFQVAMQLPDWKKEYPFLAAVPSQALQQVLINQGRAFTDAFDQANPKQFPTYKKKFIARDSFRYPQGFNFDGRRIFLPKLGWVGMYYSRPLVGTPRNVTISRRGKHWYASIQTEQDVAAPVHPTTSLVGIDRGVANFAVLSDGTSCEPQNAFRKLSAKLAKEQRKLARKVKKSRNWQKQKRKITDLHLKIANQRQDYVQKLSTTLSNSHAVIVLESLQVKNMTASAKGMVDQPGTKVRQKAGLNKAILDQGWGQFRVLLEQKQAERGGWVLYVSPAYTSQKCSGCGHVHPGNRRSQSEFICLACGLALHADLNAAINIARAGHAQLACQANGAVMPSAKPRSPVSMWQLVS